MKQVVQSQRKGEISVRDVPLPLVKPGWILVANRWSLISAGTERSIVETGERSLLEEMRSQPHLAQKLLERARTDGLRSTTAAVTERLSSRRADSLSLLGYSSAGTVLSVGPGVEGVVPGDRVACAGAGWANHAEVVTVPSNLVAKVPDAVRLEDAAYATVGAIALHAVRQADARVGERVGVIGLGLVGQLVLRILYAAGCATVGIDLDPAAITLARSKSVKALARDDPKLEATISELSGSMGLDSVLICAAAQSSDPLELGARIARDRGRLVVVGDVPIHVPRALLYEKELELRVSRSYGPGRYDRDYEEGGRDLPAGYVRWTERRNLQAFVDFVAANKIDPSELTTHRFKVDEAAEAYAVLMDPDATTRPFGILLEYAYQGERASARRPSVMRSGGRLPVRVGLIGAGTFARGVLVPALRSEGATLVAVASEGGISAADLAGQAGFERPAEAPEEVIEDPDIDAVVIATRHSSHASLTIAALSKGKAVFVEKPLALNESEIHSVAEAARRGILMVGFNRRFAPFTERLAFELGDLTDRVLAVRVNAGPLPAAHWQHDPEEGGGRLIGEGCHFVDLLAHLAQAQAIRVSGAANPQAERPLECSDNLVATLQFANGVVGSLVYSGSGDSSLPKERVEAFAGGAAFVIEDFMRFELYRKGRRKVIRQTQDKGHRAQIKCFLQAVAGTAEAPSIESYLASSLATVALAASLRNGQAVQIPPISWTDVT